MCVWKIKRKQKVKKSSKWTQWSGKNKLMGSGTCIKTGKLNLKVSPVMKPVKSVFIISLLF